MANYRTKARQYGGGGGEASIPNTQDSSSAQTPNYTSGFNFNAGGSAPASGGVLRNPRMGGIGVPMYDQFGNEIIF